MQDLGRHGGGMGHAGAADGLHQGFLNDTVLHVQSQLAGALLGSAPADAVGKTGDVGHLHGLHPLAFFRDGGGAVISPFGDGTHITHFGCVDHLRNAPLLFQIRIKAKTATRTGGGQSVFIPFIIV